MLSHNELLQLASTERTIRERLDARMPAQAALAHEWEEGMKYALLVYDVHTSWQDLSTEQKRALHGDYRALSNFPGVIGLYRLQQPKMATTVRFEEDQLVKADGPLADARPSLRAFYLLESDDHDSVLELAAGIPAARTGGAVEVWPLTELRRHDP